MTKWNCDYCGKPTSDKNKICVVCKTKDTVTEGLIDKRMFKGKVANPKDKIKAPLMSDALSRALDLEVEGRQLYLNCAINTSNNDGKSMFNFLANEEKIHYEKVAKFFEKNDYTSYCNYVEAKGLSSGVFEKKVKGGNLDGKSDALSALNVGIRAEENSIKLYQRLADDAENSNIKKFFEKLVVEENKHKLILVTEVEFVTDTGEFHDFKTVTM
jgi:rubrerythrin